jgi:hypothetical protein
MTQVAAGGSDDIHRVLLTLVLLVSTYPERGTGYQVSGMLAFGRAQRSPGNFGSGVLVMRGREYLVYNPDNLICYGFVFACQHSLDTPTGCSHARVDGGAHRPRAALKVEDRDTKAQTLGQERRGTLRK